MSEDFILKVGVEADTSDVQKQLDKKKDVTLDVIVKANDKNNLIQKELKRLQELTKDKLKLIVDDNQATQAINRVQKAYTELWKDKFQTVGQKPKVFSDMANYYKELEIESQKSTKSIQDNFVALRKETYQSIGQKSPELTKMANYYKELEQQLNSTAKAQKELNNLNLNKQGSLSSIDAFLNSNTKLNTRSAQELKQKILEIRQAIETTDDSAALKNLHKQFVNAKKEAEALGHTGKTLGDELTNNFKKFSNWVGVSAIFFGVQRALKSMVDDIIDIDTAMTSLKKVTDASDASFEKFLNNATKNAKDLGSSISDIVNSTAEFARLGYSLPEAEELGKVATLYKNVGDGITATQASQSIISTMKAYGYETDRAIEIIDKFNQVGNNFSISSAGIGEALQRSASALAEANNDLSQSIALQVGANNVIQNPETVGTMWKTVAMRIRGAKTELEEAGLETEGMVESTAKLRDLVKQMTGFDIMLDENTFKSTYDIVVGIGKEYDKLSDINQASLLEALAGKRQGNALAAALNNIQDIEKAYKSAEESAGSALREQQEYEKSIQYSLDRLGASLQEMSLLTINSGLIKGVVDLANGFINLVNSMGGLAPILTIVGGYFLLWRTNLLPSLITQIKILILSQGGMASSSVAAAAAQLGLAGSIKAVGLAIKSVMLSNPVGWILMITGAILTATTVFDSLTLSLEEAQQAYIETKTELESVNSELETTSKRIDELLSKDNLTFVEKDELTNLQKSNAELEAQKKILEDILILKAKEKNDKVYEDYNKKYKSHNRSASLYLDYSTGEEDIIYSGGKTTSALITEEDYYKRASARYEYLSKLGKERKKDQEKEYEELFEYIATESKGYQDLANDIVVTDEKSKNHKETLSELFNIGLKALHPDLWKNYKLGELLDSKGIKNTKKELLELSKASKLDKDTISKYPALKTELDKLGVSAEDVVSYIKAIKEESQDISTPTVPDLSEIFIKYSESTKLLETAKKEIKDFGTFSENTYKSLIEKFPQLKDSLGNFMLGFSDKANISKILQDQYDDDVKNYNKTLGEKLSYSKEYYDKLVNDNAGLIDEFDKQYKTDLSNCETLAKAKYKVEVELVNKLAGVWADYYDTALQGFDLQRLYDDNKITFDPRVGMNGIGLETMTEKERKQAEDLSKKSKDIRDMLSDAANLWGNFKFDDAKFLDAGKDKDKSSKDTWKEAFQAEYNYIKYLREGDYITAQQYADKLDALNQKYFANRKKYLDEYRQYDLELYKLDQELAEKRIKDWEHTLTLKINAQGEEATKGEQIRVYTQIQDELHRLAQEARKRGLAEESEVIQKYQQMWWQYEQKKFDITKQYQDKQKSLYEGYISAAERIQDLTISMIKKEMELHRDSHKEKIDDIKEEFDLKRSLLDDKLDEYDYNKNLQEKVNAANKIQGQIDLIKYDDTQKGKLAQLEDELKKAMDDLNDFQYRHSIDSQKKILDDQEKILTDKHQDEIDKIESKLDNEVYLRQEADKRIKQSGYKLYDELIKFSEDYGTISKHEVDEVWKAYEKVLENYNVSQIGLNDTLDTLYKKLSSIKDLLEEMSEMSLGEFSSSVAKSKNDLISDMKSNSQAWFTSSNKDGLAQDNIDIANRLKTEHGMDIYRGDDGYWYDRNTKKRIYHKGGFITDNDSSRFKNVRDFKSGEIEILAKTGEFMFSEGGTSGFLKNISGINNIAEKLSNFTMPKFENFELKRSFGEIVFADNGVYNLNGIDDASLTRFKTAKAEVINEAVKKISDLMKNNGGNKINIKNRY